MVYGQMDSFIDLLNEQMNMTDLTEQERDIMEYLIGSFDDDGLLTQVVGQYQRRTGHLYRMDVTEKEIEEVLLKLQEFDPAGIGARTPTRMPLATD